MDHRFTYLDLGSVHTSLCGEIYSTLSKGSITGSIREAPARLVRLDILEPNQVLACVVAQSSLFERIKARQYNDSNLLVLRETVLWGGAEEVTISDDSVLRLQGRLCVPNVDGLRETILEKAHSSRFLFNLGSMKMYCDLRQHYWRRLIKKDMVEYVARSLNFKQVKYEQQELGGLLK
ncbi:uncharacterized protein LOC142175739 [Nicotiana tabacum]|uniref:Uncharacterized protein LOC142175739 n=1 Tax=Nicotiana tabacum TaxID=4097 RepID=A0AC58TNL2_TOBAC